MLTHTQMYTHIYARMHSCRHAHTQTHTHARMRACTHTRTHTHTHTHTHVSQGNGTEEKVFEKRKVFKED